jgi:hypothetical protein
MALTLTAYSNAPETAGLRIDGGQRNHQYAVHAEASRNGLVFALGDGDDATTTTDKNGVLNWDEFGCSDGTGLDYTVTFFVDGVEASTTVTQEPVDE